MKNLYCFLNILQAMEYAVSLATAVLAKSCSFGMLH